MQVRRSLRGGVALSPSKLLVFSERGDLERRLTIKENLHFMTAPLDLAFVI